MNEIFMWIGIVALGGFFAGLMIYSFYLVLFAKHDNYQEQGSRKRSPAELPKKVQPKNVGLA